MKTEALLAELELLPVDQKIMLIDHLLHSLHPTNKIIDDAWIIEAEKRGKEIHESTARLVDGKEVLDKLRKRLYR